MIEIIADKMFELITSKGFEALGQLKEQYTNQMILYGIVKRFGEGDYFKNEFKNTLYYDNKDLILQMPERKISPTLGVQEISANLYETFIHIFIGETEEVKRITEVLSTEYLSKRELTVKLLDLAVAEKKSTEHILQDIGKTRNIVEKINDYNERAEYKKKQLLRLGLGRKMDLFINAAAGHFITWVNKGVISLKGKAGPETLQYMDQIEELVNQGFPQVTEEFHKIPVKILRTDITPFMEYEMSSTDYAVYMRTVLEKRADELLKVSDYLTDDFVYALFELMDLFERNPLYNANARLLAKMFVNAKPAEGMDFRKSCVEELTRFGETILKFKPLYNAYLQNM